MSRGMLVVCKIKPGMTRKRVWGADRVWREMESNAIECSAASTRNRYPSDARRILGY